jgi:hypothetical protein
MANVPTTLKGIAAAMALMMVFTFSPPVRSQSAPQSGAKQSGARPSGASKNQEAASDHIYPEPVDDWKRSGAVPTKGGKTTGGPAPLHDISGIWDPGEVGIQVFGAGAMPEDGKAAHALPYTPEGQEALNRNKPNSSIRGVLPSETNDPVFNCDPQGVPREDLYELRTTQIYQTPLKIVMLYTFGRVWRVIWTDGRELPKDAEPRWYGYSVGKWVDDTTLLVETTGLDERTWIDRAGRPHSADLRVEERFHRVDHDHLELSLTITDPQMYTKPWVALDKMRFELQPEDFDVREMICAPSEYLDYKKLVGDPLSSK